MRTEYPENGISTLGLADNVTVVVGKLLFEYPTIAIGGDVAAIELELSPSDLALISGATAECITTLFDPIGRNLGCPVISARFLRRSIGRA
jgi:prolyl-tRNA editing enzyme YbaK/EbsC (Cys-tRNA(Pro) deacylase)